MKSLDSTTKILCVIAVNLIITFGISIKMEFFILACLSLLFLTYGKIRKCLVYILIFAFMIFGDKVLLHYITIDWLVSFLCLIFITFRKFFFCIMTADFFISTTKINELIASLEKIHIPQVIIIPLAVLIRFFPTVKEEWEHIRAAMHMRNIGTGFKEVVFHPVKTIEYMLVPLLFSTVKIGEELSAAALARGIGMEKKRTNLYKVSFNMADYLVMIFSLAMVIFQKIYGGF